MSPNIFPAECYSANLRSLYPAAFIKSVPSTFTRSHPVVYCSPACSRIDRAINFCYVPPFHKFLARIHFFLPSPPSSGIHRSFQGKIYISSQTRFLLISYDSPLLYLYISSIGVTFLPFAHSFSLKYARDKLREAQFFYSFPVVFRICPLQSQIFTNTNKESIALFLKYQNVYVINFNLCS